MQRERDERNGIRRGQRVRDADGKPMGRVTRLFEWGFEVRPWLFGRMHVVGYEEAAVRDGALVVARSERDLFALAAGEARPSASALLPAPPRPGAAAPATPGEVRRPAGSHGPPFSRPAGAHAGH